MCKKYNITYEILICEQIDDKNVSFMKDKLINTHHVHIFDMQQKYPNPFNFNLIESYGKNYCLKKAIGEYVCMTSADQLFSEDFFIFIKTSLQKKIFYRFATYEIPIIDISDIYTNDNYNIESLLEKCKNSNKRLCNPGCFDSNINAIKLGQKSGDIMLLDRESFNDIKGWPENDCFTHMDTVVCIVATNNFQCYIPDKNVCTYTFQKPAKSYNQLDDNNTDELVKQNIEMYQWEKCLSYINKNVCN
jgi:hypothetical protein